MVCSGARKCESSPSAIACNCRRSGPAGGPLPGPLPGPPPGPRADAHREPPPGGRRRTRRAGDMAHRRPRTRAAAARGRRPGPPHRNRRRSAFTDPSPPGTNCGASTGRTRTTSSTTWWRWPPATAMSTPSTPGHSSSAGSLANSAPSTPTRCPASTPSPSRSATSYASVRTTTGPDGAEARTCSTDTAPSSR
ncbi:hypothetical protein LK06_019095 [Streptomyces pluripotens]|nr:hypothetical protein LK06_019095 [Streptomyces pluripotens]